MVYGLNSIPIKEHLRYANDKLLIVSVFSILSNGGDCHYTVMAVLFIVVVSDVLKIYITSLLG